MILKQFSMKCQESRIMFDTLDITKDILTPDHKLWPIFINRLRIELRDHNQNINLYCLNDLLTLENCYVRGKIETIKHYEYIDTAIMANGEKFQVLMRIDTARSLKVIYELERDYNTIFDINKTMIFFRQYGGLLDLSILKNVEKRYRKKIRKKITFINLQGIGDVVAMTAAIRDLKLAYPYLDVTILSNYNDVFLNNPYARSVNSFVKIDDEDSEFYIIDFRAPFFDYLQYSYPHFLGGFHKSVIYETGLTYNSSSLLPDLHVTTKELDDIRKKFELKKPYWIINAGHRKSVLTDVDGTMKWWGVRNYQEVVNSLKHKMRFVQIGGKSDTHTQLENATSLIGQTNLRELICLIYDSNGTIGPISGHMHIAAAFGKPSVVIGGGFEDFMLTKYPKQRNIHSIGLLPCCRSSGCWTCHAAVACDNRVDGLCKCMFIIKPSQIISDLEHIFNMDQ